MARGCLWVKRDDLTGLAGGGNKARKLEHLCGAALAAGADTLLTGGAAQSNHVRMTAAAAAALGLGCVAVLFGRPTAVREGNLALDHLLGAEVVWAAGDEPEAAFAATRDELAGRGASVYEIPLGGSSPVGALGYVTCADELVAEAPAGALVVCADGSGGTHAGLAAGFGDHARVLGVDVGFGDVGPVVGTLAAATAALAGRPAPIGRPEVDPGQPEPYGAPTEATWEALSLAARTEGLVLDPVYTGRALAALVARRRSGAVAADQPVVFLHTGGPPALLTSRYAPWFADAPLPPPPPA
jgi:D-cysteine desulfhydrase